VLNVNNLKYLKFNQLTVYESGFSGYCEHYWAMSMRLDVLLMINIIGWCLDLLLICGHLIGPLFFATVCYFSLTLILSSSNFSQT